MPLTLRNARELFEVLRNPDAHITMALHRSLCRAPQQAMQLGRFEGRDVVDELLAQAREAGETNHGLLLTRTLTMFPTARVARYFRSIFLTTGRPDFLRVSAAWLAAQHEDDERATLLQGLMQNESVLRAREAARWFRTDRGLAPAQRVRVSLLDTREPPRPAPPLQEPFISAWLTELGGPFKMEARAALSHQGTEAETVLRCWTHRLDAEDLAWLEGLNTPAG